MTAAALPAPLATGQDPAATGGLTGWIVAVIESLGALGVGLLVALENLVPPIPSELVLSVSGYLAAAGRLDVALVALTATAGSVLGALALYWLGHALGEDRLRRWLDRIPLVDAGDLDRADRWFERHERGAVFFGRMVPVVRSLVSIPAGANRMPLGEFTILTALGSGVWNGLFIAGGYALGERWQQLDRYAAWFDAALLAAFVLVAGVWVRRKLRERASADR
ncbi:membrane protein DedA with SNARE-associated domain [Krasilnikovia cinnamomea]|uniref:Membrane protein DedA with SNARE-associated domain n=1 Tax=Krasilnikovia cinnamomea TaxID=349313 RepID=A0A4Q7ZGU3_9ACTN|nr:DedA family protein [Krasilnikovia cinnamomea]RZU49997.1 membrane protein DedA with SNARE-associated domain [Krasilnikovia cinnamomea]